MKKTADLIRFDAQAVKAGLKIRGCAPDNPECNQENYIVYINGMAVSFNK